MSPTLYRVTRMRTPGWKMPANTVSVARPGRWGNPFKVGGCVTLNGPTVTIWNAEQAVALYRAWLLLNPGLLLAVPAQLRGKNLACYCPQFVCAEERCGTVITLHGWVGACCPRCGGPMRKVACHADVLMEIANATP